LIRQVFQWKTISNSFQDELGLNNFRLGDFPLLMSAYFTKAQINTHLWYLPRILLATGSLRTSIFIPSPFQFARSGEHPTCYPVTLLLSSFFTHFPFSVVLGFPRSKGPVLLRCFFPLILLRPPVPFCCFFLIARWILASLFP